MTTSEHFSVHHWDRLLKCTLKQVYAGDTCRVITLTLCLELSGHDQTFVCTLSKL